MRICVPLAVVLLFGVPQPAAGLPMRQPAAGEWQVSTVAGDGKELSLDGPVASRGRVCH